MPLQFVLAMYGILITFLLSKAINCKGKVGFWTLDSCTENEMLTGATYCGQIIIYCSSVPLYFCEFKVEFIVFLQEICTSTECRCVQEKPTFLLHLLPVLLILIHHLSLVDLCLFIFMVAIHSKFCWLFSGGIG